MSKNGREFFDSALSHTRRSDTSEKREEISVSTFGRFRLCTSFESSSVSVNFQLKRLYSSNCESLISLKNQQRLTWCQNGADQSFLSAHFIQAAYIDSDLIDIFANQIWKKINNFKVCPTNQRKTSSKKSLFPGIFLKN